MYGDQGFWREPETVTQQSCSMGKNPALETSPFVTHLIKQR